MKWLVLVLAASCLAVLVVPTADGKSIVDGFNFVSGAHVRGSSADEERTSAGGVLHQDDARKIVKGGLLHLHRMLHTQHGGEDWDMTGESFLSANAEPKSKRGMISDIIYKNKPEIEFNAESDSKGIKMDPIKLKSFKAEITLQPRVQLFVAVNREHLYIHFPKKGSAIKLRAWHDSWLGRKVKISMEVKSVRFDFGKGFDIKLHKTNVPWPLSKILPWALEKVAGGFVPVEMTEKGYNPYNDPQLLERMSSMGGSKAEQKEAKKKGSKTDPALSKVQEQMFQFCLSFVKGEYGLSLIPSPSKPVVLRLSENEQDGVFTITKGARVSFRAASERENLGIGARVKLLDVIDRLQFKMLQFDFDPALHLKGTSLAKEGINAIRHVKVRIPENEVVILGGRNKAIEPMKRTRDFSLMMCLQVISSLGRAGQGVRGTMRNVGKDPFTGEMEDDDDMVPAQGRSSKTAIHDARAECGGMMGEMAMLISPPRERVNYGQESSMEDESYLGVSSSRLGREGGAASAASLATGLVDAALRKECFDNTEGHIHAKLVSYVYQNPRALWLGKMQGKCLNGYPLFLDRDFQRVVSIDDFHGRQHEYQILRKIINKKTDTQLFVLQRTLENGKKEANVVFRGSDSTRDWCLNFNFYRTSGLLGKQIGENSPAHFPGTIHTGFLTQWASVRDQVINLLDSSFDGFRNGETLVVSGHSLGAGTAALAAYNIKRRFAALHTRQDSVRAYLYGTPRVGDKAFVDAFNDYIPATYNYNTEFYGCIYGLKMAGQDLVTTIPPIGLGFFPVGKRCRAMCEMTCEGRELAPKAPPRKCENCAFQTLTAECHAPAYYANSFLYPYSEFAPKTTKNLPRLGDTCTCPEGSYGKCPFPVDMNEGAGFG